MTFPGADTMKGGAIGDDIFLPILDLTLSLPGGSPSIPDRTGEGVMAPSELSTDSSSGMVIFRLWRPLRFDRTGILLSNRSTMVGIKPFFLSLLLPSNPIKALCVPPPFFVTLLLLCFARRIYRADVLSDVSVSSQRRMLARGSVRQDRCISEAAAAFYLSSCSCTLDIRRIVRI
ncbi:hypothetical protein H113_06235 [Trichophyton rubrum MR1459]|uniref:Uncharacterized protein n=1 Tax=Trichophyton rubrum (strain ATCC MYA-4607 / CBS 118892) TaxID=559305 RepID=A0A080WKR5_TRIRC|nr:uncharacterized protein TERG_11734 [Trichophyton rubrum CBS 118892]EZF92774.1 hypothetical protein H113_06235 [Trichophyton rubrum MR1459]EZG03783.1 hypothetical protein H106_06029 [Trichophyton rubrum CBS 735.88]KFL60635.1 hypothetical protein TERG_11734 [Trichophyton rubrum CBS 118892]